eukprot:1145311-Pelagomonas_calceolata.AAC.4
MAMHGVYLVHCDRSVMHMEAEEEEEGDFFDADDEAEDEAAIAAGYGLGGYNEAADEREKQGTLVEEDGQWGEGMAPEGEAGFISEAALQHEQGRGGGEEDAVEDTEGGVYLDDFLQGGSPEARCVEKLLGHSSFGFETGTVNGRQGYT